jgi:hypothetical protein
MRLRKFHVAGVEALQSKKKRMRNEKRIKRASLSQETTSRIHEKDKEAHRVRRASLDDEEEASRSQSIQQTS